MRTDIYAYEVGECMKPIHRNLVCAFFFLPLVAFAANIASAKKDLEEALIVFDRLAEKLPFSAVSPAARRAELKSRYDNIRRMVVAAIAKIESDVEATKSLINGSFQEFSQTMELLPIESIEDPFSKVYIRLDIVRVHLLLYAAIEWLKEGPASEEKPALGYPWRYNGLFWSPLPAKLSVKQAEEACRALTAFGKSGWRLPRIKELQDAVSTMKNPMKNHEFGFAAAQYDEVWSADKDPMNERFRLYLHFQRIQVRKAESETPFQVVCVIEE